MPCYRCGTRQVDPERGKSPWKRGVLREHQVLVCPACQPAADADLDRCARCGSRYLIRRLDQVECLDCRLIREAELEPAFPVGAFPGTASASGGGSGGSGSGSATSGGDLSGGEPSGGEPSGGDAPGTGGSDADRTGGGGPGADESGASGPRGGPRGGASGEGAAPDRQGSDPTLAAEVARALDKVLGRR